MPDVDSHEQTFRVLPAGRLILVLADRQFARHPGMIVNDPGSVEARNSMDARVHLSGPDGFVQTEEGLYAGRHTYRWPLAPGSYKLRVVSRYVGRFEADVHIEPHEEATVEIELKRGRR